MSLITDELVRAVHTATLCRRNASARRAENVLSLYCFCHVAARAVSRVFACVAHPGQSGRPARFPGIVTKHISWILCSINEVEFNRIILNHLSNEVIAYINMFDSSLLYRIRRHKYGSLVVSAEWDRCGI
jgi:hypothetical protein